MISLRRIPHSLRRCDHNACRRFSAAAAAPAGDIDVGYRSDNETAQLDPKKLITTQTTNPRDFKFSRDMLFGQQYSDHMLVADWTRTEGWAAPEIVPFDDLKMHPASSCLHYGLQCFEGLKVYRGVDGKIRLFRPLDHMKRFAFSTTRLTMPAIPPHIALQLMKSLVQFESKFVPQEPECSMYLRPTMIGTTPKLGVTPPDHVKFFTVCNPCGAYFAGGLKPMSLLADTQYVRAWQGSAGGAKVGGNYGAVMLPQLKAQERGYSQPMWLVPRDVDGRLDYEITEGGTLNLFILWKTKTGEVELVTAPLSDLILPGINRLSVIEIMKKNPEILKQEYGNIKMVERSVMMSEFTDALDRGNVLEFFGTGTAANVISVSTMGFDEIDYQIPAGADGVGGGPLVMELRRMIADIQYGRTPDHPWAPVVEIEDESRMNHSSLNAP